MLEGKRSIAALNSLSFLESSGTDFHAAKANLFSTSALCVFGTAAAKYLIRRRNAKNRRRVHAAGWG